MSVNFTTIFTQVNALLKQANTWIAEQNTLTVTNLPNIETAFAGNTTAIPTVITDFTNFSSQVQTWVQQIISGYVRQSLASYQAELNATGSSTSALISALQLAMVNSAQTVQQNTATVSAVSVGGSNVGTGALLVLATNQQFGGVDQRLFNESFSVVCSGDQFSGTAASAESFSAAGYPSGSSYSGAPMGSGGATLNVTDGSGNILSNGSFDTYTSSGAFSGWTVEALASGSWYGAYTLVTSGGIESLPSPVSTAVVSTGSLASQWTMGTIPSGATANFYMKNSTTGELIQQAKGIVTTSYSATRFIPSNVTPPATSSASFGPVAVPSPPATSTVAGGTLAATTYYVKTTLVTAVGETTASTEASQAVALDYLLTVTYSTQSQGVTGYNVYVSTATGTETKQNASPIAIGTTWTEPTSGLIAGSSPPATNTATYSAPTITPTAVTYTPSTSVLQDSNYTATATTGGSLLLTPNATGDIAVSQTLNLSQLAAVVASQFAVQSNNCASGSTLLVDVEATGGQAYSVDPSTLATTFAFQRNISWITAIPDYATFRIVWKNSASTGGQVRVDSCSVATAAKLGNVYMASMRGSVDFRKKDQFSFSTTNNNTGEIQTGFGRFYNVQLNSSNSPTIADSI